MTMEYSYWTKQTKNQPLYPDMLWARPENKLAAGKLLIIGGNLHGFAGPALAYNEAIKAGIGTVRILLPNVIQKIVGPILENGEFTASTLSGSFGQQALGDFLDCANWADGVLLAGDFGRNSETAILLEAFLAKSSAAVTITKDAANYVATTPQTILHRPQTTLVVTLGQLQKLCIALSFHRAITSSMGLLHLVEALHELTTLHQFSIIVKQQSQIVVASRGKVSTTRLDTDLPLWCIQTAAHATVWWLQNPSKPFEALTTSLVA